MQFLSIPCNLGNITLQASSLCVRPHRKKTYETKRNLGIYSYSYLYFHSITGINEVKLWVRPEAEQEAQVHEVTTLLRTEEPKRKKQNYETRTSFQGRRKERAQLRRGKNEKSQSIKGDASCRRLTIT